MSPLPLKDVLLQHVVKSPSDGVVTLLFFCAILHTFCAPFLSAIAKKRSKKDIWKWTIHVLGEVEWVFGLWVVPLTFLLLYYKGAQETLNYFRYQVNYREPLFVIVIMCIAATRPILAFVENALSHMACFLGGGIRAWWFVVLTFAPFLGSFITEPAAMTLAALLIDKHFYSYNPPWSLRYGTLGLLFVNVSIGGALTHFAAPPVLMVASRWSWGTPFMLKHFSWVIICGAVLSTLLYLVLFYKQFPNEIKGVGANTSIAKKAPCWLTLAHLAFLAWTVINLHHEVLFLGGFLVFLLLFYVTRSHQDKFEPKVALMVGCFLAGLVIHGNFQQWWLAPVLAHFHSTALFWGATLLTAFNDNAAITYLASLVPLFSGQLALQKAVVAGAITGGGLTIIANAPNPAGQAILQRYFPRGVHPAYLFAAALPPTLIVAFFFMIEIGAF